MSKVEFIVDGDIRVLYDRGKLNYARRHDIDGWEPVTNKTAMRSCDYEKIIRGALGAQVRIAELEAERDREQQARKRANVAVVLAQEIIVKLEAEREHFASLAASRLANETRMRIELEKTVAEREDKLSDEENAEIDAEIDEALGDETFRGDY